MKALQGGTRQAFLVFFASHIVFTLCIDLQAIGKTWYPTILQNLVTEYARFCHDPLMSGEPRFELWFQSIVVFEMIFQLPFFFCAVHFFSDPTVVTYPLWFHRACIIYGSHTATTLVPILPTLWFQDINHNNNNDENEDWIAPPLEKRILLVLIYLPYFVFPAWLAAIAALDGTDNNNNNNSNSNSDNNMKVKRR